MYTEKLQHCHKRAELKTTAGLLLLEPFSDSIIRVRLHGEGQKALPSPLGLLPRGEDAPDWTLTETPDIYRLQTPALSLTVCRKTGRLCFQTADGAPLLSQPAPELATRPVVKYNTANATIRRVKTIDGERNFVENLEEYEDRTAYRARIFFDFQPDERIFGLGQGEEGIWNYRRTVQYLYQNNMRIPVPFFLSDKGYGVLVDTGSLMTFNDDARGSYLFLDTVDALDYYIIAGQKPDDIIAGFRRLTGPAALLPKWAYGYVQSKEAYRTQQEVLETAREYRRRRIPLDCIVQDWNTWEPGRWGNKRVDKTRYPNLAEMNRELHDLHVHSMVSVWPNMDASGEDHREFLEAGYLLADFSTYNAFDENARRLYWEQANRELFSGGFDAWWCDSTEPFCGPDWSGEVQREPWERYVLVGNELKKFLDPATANLYALRHAQGMYENQRAQAPEKRVLNLTRSGSAGSQRYGAVLWSGDISATWDTLRRQIAEGLNMCMSGLPWWTLDIGGFFVVKDNWQGRGCGADGNPNPLWFWRGGFEQGVDDLGYRELYVRWLQMGAFLPMFRSHGTDTPREIWHFGEPGTPFYDAIEAFIRLRYRLLPTVYSLAGRVALEGYTMLRSLVFDFSHDETAKDIGHQFLFGDSLLVCPVTEPQFYGAGSTPLEKPATRDCYLPAGADWYDYWDGTLHKGGQWITTDTPLERIPLFVKAGSLLVMEQDALEYATQTTDKPLEIRVWPGADADFTLYEDSGDGYDYENGRYNRIPLHWDEAARTLSVGAANHTFPQSMNGRRCVLCDGTGKTTFVYNGSPLQITL